MNDANPNSPADPPLFSAVLTPHRSLGTPGFLALMAAVAILNVIGAAMMFAIGAWPILPFLGLDILVVYLAFRANYLQARAREEVVVTPVEIRVRKISSRGQAREWRFNAAWTRLVSRVDEEDGTVLELTLDEGRRRLPIATFLPPVERKDFGRALMAALHEAKRGPTRTIFA